MSLVCTFPGNHLFIADQEAFSFHLEELVMYFCFYQEREEKAGVPLERH